MNGFPGWREPSFVAPTNGIEVTDCGRRRARLHRLVAILTAVLLLGTLAGGLAGSGGAAATTEVPFVPYIDIGLWPTPDLAALSAESGIEEFTLAFVQSNGTCSPHWAGVTPLADNFMGPQIQALRAAGGDVIISFGGASGVELGEACTTVDSLAAAYRSVADHYQVYSLDYDIEGAAAAHPASIELRSKAIAKLQADYQAVGRDLEVSLTLPALPTGLTQDGLNVVSSARDYGVDVSVVNIMAMDYGAWAAPNPAGNMGTYGIQAAQSLRAQLGSLYPSKTSSELWAMVGITPMIGQNDVAAERLSAAEAAQIRQFAVDNGAGRLAMWSVTRDQPCPGGPSQWASATCSGVNEARWAFSAAFRGQAVPPPPSSTTTAPGSTTTTTAPSTTTTAPTQPAQLPATVTVSTDWGTGYCADVKVTNSGTAPVDWTSKFNLPVAASVITSSWSANIVGATSPVTASGVSWNDVLAPGASTTFGFCADRSGVAPTTTAVPTTTTTTPPTTTAVPTTTTTAVPTTTTTAAPSTTTTVPAGGLVVTQSITSDWGSGYCAEVKVKNASAGSLTWSTTLAIASNKVSSLWDAQWSAVSGGIKVSGKPWNLTLAAGATTTFGYCANR